MNNAIWVLKKSSQKAAKFYVESNFFSTIRNMDTFYKSSHKTTNVAKRLPQMPQALRKRA